MVAVTAFFAKTMRLKYLFLKVTRLSNYRLFWLIQLTTAILNLVNVNPYHFCYHKQFLRYEIRRFFNLVSQPWTRLKDENEYCAYSRKCIYPTIWIICMLSSVKMTSTNKIRGVPCLGNESSTHIKRDVFWTIWRLLDGFLILQFSSSIWYWNIK